MLHPLFGSLGVILNQFLYSEDFVFVHVFEVESFEFREELIVFSQLKLSQLVEVILDFFVGKGGLQLNIIGV